MVEPAPSGLASGVKLEKSPVVTRIVLFLFIVVSGLVVAHLFRFAPMPGGDPLGFTPMWDRWFQRVCVVSFAGDNRLSCSMQAFRGQFAKSKEATLRPMTKLEEARLEGYSELEIMKYIEEQIKTKRHEGMSDADIAVSLFGPRGVAQNDTQ